MLSFYRVGKYTCRYPVRISIIACVLGAIMALGAMHMHIQNDPQRLWVPPASVSAKQQATFNSLFHPFFRVQQLIFYVNEENKQSAAPSNHSSFSHDLVARKYLLKLAEVQLQIARQSVDVEPYGKFELEDFCYRPIKGKGCLVTSPFQYWLGNTSLLREDPDIKLTTACQSTDKTLQQRAPCMDENGIPVMRNVVFGGLSNDSCHVNPDPCGEATPEAKTMMVTFLLRNDPSNATYTHLVEQWEERVFLATAKRAQTELQQHAHQWDGMKLTYMAERSVPDSLRVQTKQNAFVVAVSYLIMFLYVSMALGKFNDPIHSRYGLGLTGICIVLMSMGAAIGICCALFQMEVTMITLEVVPFLILAIGVDNMFILTNEFDRIRARRGHAATSSGASSSYFSMRVRSRHEDDLMLEGVMGETMANVGPSIVVAAFSECLAFLVGALTRIPALETFCIVAAVAVMVNFGLQLSWFTAALVLDARRVRARRYDLCPCLRQSISLSPDKSVLRESMSSPVAVSSAIVHGNSRIQSFIEKSYTPFIFKRSVRLLVLISASCFVWVSCMGVTKIPLGLPQELAVPTDFYLHEYFQMQTKFGEAGPPAYLVLGHHVNYTDGQVQQNINQLLNDYSSVQQYIQLPIYSWLNSFNQWRQMRSYLQEQIDQQQCDCPLQPMDPFAYEIHPRAKPPARVTPNTLFYPLVENFTKIAIDSQCCQHFGFCGAQYEDDIVFDKTDGGTHGIEGSRMRFQVNALKNQTMFVNSFYYLQKVARKWQSRLPVFPYSLYFVYYEQYVYIQGVALQSVLMALAVVFFTIYWLMDRNLRLSLIVTICVLSMTTSVLGFVFIWNSVSSIPTSINAVSVVNLLACVGLGVEFCVHMAHQFAYSVEHRLGQNARDHTKHALATVGASIISGITLTKFCGIGVLAFAPSMLFRVYFFRMYLGIVVMGFFHGLVLLPVLLSLFGLPRAHPEDFSSFLLYEEMDYDEE